MAATGFATPSLSWSSSNLPDAFRSFRQYCQLIFDGPFAAKSEKEKVTYLLLWIGSHGRDIYDGWTWTNPDERYQLDAVFNRFEKHIEPQVNSYLARFHFHQCRQAVEESVDEFIARCRVLAAKCKFADQLETNTRLTEQLIVGTKHVQVQEKLLEKGDGLASLDAAMDIARTFEATKLHVAQLQAAGPVQVDAVSTRRTPHPPCGRCGLSHGEDIESCPAYGKKCHVCGKLGHFRRFCRSSGGNQKTPRTSSRQNRSYGRQKDVHNMDIVCKDFSTMSFEVIEIDDVKTEASTMTAQIQFELDGRRGRPNLKGKIDTGAQGNIPLLTPCYDPSAHS